MRTLIHLRESLDTFSSTEKRIALYILDHLDTLSDISINTIATECQTSKSMVVQMCKKSGYKGFKDLCSCLAVERALSRDEAESAQYGEIRPNWPTEQICAATMREEIRSLQNTLDLLDDAQMEAAVDAVLGARRIRLFGVGNSAVVAMDMHNKLQRIGLSSHFSLEMHTQLTGAATLTQEDCALVFSYGGNTRAMIEAARCALDGGATVISITRYGHNPISDMASIALYVAANESLVRSAAMSSRLAMLSMVDMLFCCVASRCHNSIRGLLKRTAQIIEDIKK